MKTFFKNFKPATILLFAIAAFSFTACDEEEVVTPPLKEQIAGTWDITSYNLGGDEYMGFIIESASLEFGTYTGAEGVFTEVVTFPGEEPISISGPYRVDEDHQKVFMTFEGDMIIAEVEINGDQLEWDGTQDGFPLVLKATRQ